MKHLVWGILSSLIGAFFMLSVLVLNIPSVATTILYGAVFLGYGVYRIKQYYDVKRQSDVSKVDSEI